MKKQFQILTVTFITVVFVSCSKEKVEQPETSVSTVEEISTSSSSARPYVDPLTIGLEGWFTFNGHLKDATKQLPDGGYAPKSRTGVSYTTDRKGIAKAALKMNGNYFVALNTIPQKVNTSLSVWVKREAEYSIADFMTPYGNGIGLTQYPEVFRSHVFTDGSSPYVNSDISNDLYWHHFVITYDGSSLKLYRDGVLKNTTVNAQPFADDIINYHIGDLSIGEFWKGSLDDLRFYSRTLSATDVQNLFNQ